MVRVQIQLNARSKDSEVAGQFRLHNARQAMLPHNALPLPVAQPHGPVQGQAALHKARIDLGDMELAREDALQLHQYAGSPNGAFQSLKKNQRDQFPSRLKSL